MNDLLHSARKRNGLKQWEVAEIIGIREDTFSKKLRHELPKDEQLKIIEAIETHCRKEKK